MIFYYICNILEEKKVASRQNFFVIFIFILT